MSGGGNLSRRSWIARLREDVFWSSSCTYFCCSAANTIGIELGSSSSLLCAPPAPTTSAAHASKPAISLSLDSENGCDGVRREAGSEQFRVVRPWFLCLLKPKSWVRYRLGFQCENPNNYSTNGEFNIHKFLRLLEILVMCVLMYIYIYICIYIYIYIYVNCQDLMSYNK
jgi:hypothetical protein